MKYKLLILSLVLSCNVLYSQSYNEYKCRGLFCNVKKHYNYTVELHSPSNKISAFHFFLSKHKNSRFSDDAASKLAILEEARDWVIAKSENTIESYNQFIKSYPSHIYNQEGYESGSLERIILIKLIDFWFITDSINTIGSYQEFIDNYPNKYIDNPPNNKCWICNEEFPYADTALMRISIIKDNDSWDEIKDKVTSIYFEEYLLNFPNGRYRNEAIQKIEDISIQPDWIKIKKKNSISSFRDFINQYPNSSYSQLAQEELVKIELSYWNKAQSRNRRTYYIRYLENFPDGKYVNEALKNKMELEIKEREREGLASGQLPTTQETFNYNIDANEHHFTIINMTEDLGKKSGTTIKATYEASTDEGLKKGTISILKNECEKIVLIPGTYYFTVIDKSDKSVTPYYGTYECSGGHRSNPLGLYISESKKYTFNGQTIDFSLPEVPLTLEQKKVLFEKYENCYE